MNIKQWQEKNGFTDEDMDLLEAILRVRPSKRILELGDQFRPGKILSIIEKEK